MDLRKYQLFILGRCLIRQRSKCILIILQQNKGHASILKFREPHQSIFSAKLQRVGQNVLFYKELFQFVLKFACSYCSMNLQIQQKPAFLLKQHE